MMDIDKLKELYGFNTASLKWSPEGGDLMNYIGLGVICVDFEKDSSGKWGSTTYPVVIKEIGDYNPQSMTWIIKYYKLDDPDKKILEEQIIPEGFSFSIADNGLQSKMLRFIPEHLHIKCMEEAAFYERLEKLYDTTDTLPLENVQQISSSKERKNLLRYTHNICAICKVKDTGEILKFRLWDLKLRAVKGKASEITLVDEDKNTYILKVREDEKKYSWSVDGKEIGDLKIIDLQGKGGD